MALQYLTPFFLILPVKTTALLVLIIAWIPIHYAYAELPSTDPHKLCSLLAEDGIETSEYKTWGDPTIPLCFTLSEPKSKDLRERGYAFEYRVVGHWQEDRPWHVLINVEGSRSKIIEDKAQLKLARLLGKVLGALTDAPRRELVTYVEHLLPPSPSKAFQIGDLSVTVVYDDHSAMFGAGDLGKLRVDIK